MRWPTCRTGLCRPQPEAACPSSSSRSPSAWGYTAYRTAKAASSGDYITAAEIGLSLMAVVYNDYGGFQSAGARGGGVGYAASGGVADNRGAAVFSP